MPQSGPTAPRFSRRCNCARHAASWQLGHLAAELARGEKAAPELTCIIFST